MIGDANDMQQRLRLTLPARWFADVAPVLDGILAGMAAAWSGLYALLQLVQSQSRIATASGEFLDLAAVDFFGATVVRRTSETDAAFRARLHRAIMRERGTRDGLVAAAGEAGFTVAIFEAARPADTGAYNIAPGLAWNTLGGWGSLQMPLECIVTATSDAVSYQSELMPGIAQCLPAGGAAWVRIES